MGGRKEVFGMELAGVLGEVRNPGYPSCRLCDGRWRPSPHPARFAPHPLRARLSVGLSCFTAYLSFHSQAYPAGGLGRRPLRGARRSLTREIGEWGLTLQLSDVLCVAWGRLSPWSQLQSHLPGESQGCPTVALGQKMRLSTVGQVLSVGLGWGPRGF